jgi:fluoroquinolone resistance protein
MPFFTGGHFYWYTQGMNLLTDTTLSYYKETFTGLTYTNNKIADKEFEDCLFEKCIFIDCVFENCRFLDCTFSECSISATKPFNSQFATVHFKDSKVMGVDWTRASSIRQLTFNHCNISYSNFSFLKLPQLQLIDCIAKEVNFNSTDLTAGVFTKTDFLQSIFSSTNLTRADFRHASNYGIDFHFNVLKKAKFSLPEAMSLLTSLEIELEG